VGVDITSNTAAPEPAGSAVGGRLLAAYFGLTYAWSLDSLGASSNPLPRFGRGRAGVASHRALGVAGPWRCRTQRVGLPSAAIRRSPGSDPLDRAIAT
jgi:hypothetical protein